MYAFAVVLVARNGDEDVVDLDAHSGGERLDLRGEPVGQRLEPAEERGRRAADDDEDDADRRQAGAPTSHQRGRSARPARPRRQRRWRRARRAPEGGEPSVSQPLQDCSDSPEARRRRASDGERCEPAARPTARPTSTEVRTRLRPTRFRRRERRLPNEEGEDGDLGPAEEEEEPRMLG
jgi:hypothetical protein